MSLCPHSLHHQEYAVCNQHLISRFLIGREINNGHVLSNSLSPRSPTILPLLHHPYPLPEEDRWKHQANKDITSLGPTHGPRPAV